MNKNVLRRLLKLIFVPLFIIIIPFFIGDFFTSQKEKALVYWFHGLMCILAGCITVFVFFFMLHLVTSIITSAIKWVKTGE